MLIVATEAWRGFWVFESVFPDWLNTGACCVSEWHGFSFCCDEGSSLFFQNTAVCGTTGQRATGTGCWDRVCWRRWAASCLTTSLSSSQVRSVKWGGQTCPSITTDLQSDFQPKSADISRRCSVCAGCQNGNFCVSFFMFSLTLVFVLLVILVYVWTSEKYTGTPNNTRSSICPFRKQQVINELYQSVISVFYFDLW